MESSNESMNADSTSRTPYVVTELGEIGKSLYPSRKLHIGDVYKTDPRGKRRKISQFTLSRDEEFIRVYEANSARILASYPDHARCGHICAPHCLLTERRNGRRKRLLWQAIAERPVSSYVPPDAQIEVPHGLSLKLSIEQIDGSGKRIHEDELEMKQDSIEEIVGGLDSTVLGGKVFLLAALDNGHQVEVRAYTDDLSRAGGIQSHDVTDEDVLSLTMTDSAQEAQFQQDTNAGSDLQWVVVLSSVKLATGRTLRIRIFKMFLKPGSTDELGFTPHIVRDIWLDALTSTDLFRCRVYDLDQVYIWGGRRLQIFNLADTSKPYREIILEDRITSVLRLDRSSIAVCSPTTFRQIELEYMTALGVLRWSSLENHKAATKDDHQQLISYDKRAKTILCLHGSRIITIAAKDNASSSLADLMQTRTPYANLPKPDADLVLDTAGDSKLSEWHKYAADLGNCIKTNNVEAFESVFENILVSILGKQYSNADKESIDIYAMVTAPGPPMKHSKKLAVIITHIFEAIGDIQSDGIRLQVKILSHKTLMWLARNGFLRPEALDISFQKMAMITSSQHVQETAVVDALAKLNDGSVTLKRYLIESKHISAAEALRIAVLALEAVNEPSAPRLTNGTSDEMEIDSISQIQVATTSREEASHNELIRLALDRLLNHNKQETITQALRKHTTQPQLFSLLDFIRIELSEQGWFTEILTSPQPQITNSDNNLPVTNLIKLLSSILDAMGLTPWLSSSISPQAENLISWMKLEISAAFEAAEEASYAEHILHEALLFTKLLQAPATEPVKEKQHIARRKRPIIVNEAVLGDNALPLGLKPKGYVDTNVVRQGEVVKMSKRQRGYEKSKIVGRYGRERIVFD